MKKIVLAILSISTVLFQVPSLFADERLISFGNPVPIGISQKWFWGNFYCGGVISIYPTKDSCPWWHVYGTYPPSDANLRNRILEPMLQALQAGTYEIPWAEAYQTRYNFIGRTLSL
jgi:hypothetical protein